MRGDNYDVCQRWTGLHAIMKPHALFPQRCTASVRKTEEDNLVLCTITWTTFRQPTNGRTARTGERSVMVEVSIPPAKFAEMGNEMSWPVTQGPWRFRTADATLNLCSFAGSLRGNALPL